MWLVKDLQNQWTKNRVPKLFGHHGPVLWKTFFHGRSRYGKWFQHDSSHYSYCALNFYYCYVSSTSNHQAGLHRLHFVLENHHRNVRKFLHLLTMKTAGHWPTFQIQFFGTFNQKLPISWVIEMCLHPLLWIFFFPPQPVAISSIHPHRNRGDCSHSSNQMIFALFGFSFPHRWLFTALNVASCRGVGHLSGVGE